jgi:SAM-dependent methyltransferase
VLTQEDRFIKSMPIRHRIHFPPQNANDLSQDEVFFYVIEDGEKIRLRFHDYAAIYARPGLYEQLFYERLKCTSPTKVADILRKTVEAHGQDATALRVLDLGAGNGMMGDALKSQGVSRLVGVDIIAEARAACLRDRPGMYDEYYVADFTALSPTLHEEICEWQVNCLTSVAALGFGDIPQRAFVQALQFVLPGGWVAFNIKHTFLDPSDTTGFRPSCASYSSPSASRSTTSSATGIASRWRATRSPTLRSCSARPGTFPRPCSSVSAYSPERASAIRPSARPDSS